MTQPPTTTLLVAHSWVPRENFAAEIEVTKMLDLDETYCGLLHNADGIKIVHFVEWVAKRMISRGRNVIELFTILELEGLGNRAGLTWY